MSGQVDFFEKNIQIFFSKLNSEYLVLSGTVIMAAAVLYVCITLYHFKIKTNEDQLPEADVFAPEPGMADDNAGPIPPAFAAALVSVGEAAAVPLPPLQIILSKLIDAGVAQALIPNRLRAAAGHLKELRSKLADWHDEGPGHGNIRSEALACLDRGDFDALSEVLRQGREAGWTYPIASRREEAQFLAREAMVDHVQLRHGAAAETYAAAAALAAGVDSREEWQFRMAQAFELCEAARQSGPQETVLRAIEIYHQALGLARREELPFDWAATKHALGNALLLLGQQAKEPEPLQDAVNAYLEAVEEWTRESSPLEWAKAQNNLGDALQLLGERESDPDRLRQAAEAYRAALSGCAPETAPFEWAQACNRLGETLAALGVMEGGGERLVEAVKYYREALEGINREVAPLEWAMIQNNLGQALEMLAGNETETGLLRQAAAAYQAALDDRCRDLAPLEWAASHTNLGHALVSIAERENNEAMLEEAALAYRAALAACPAGQAPLETAKTHVNLAYALGALWNRTRRQSVLDEALSAVEAALDLIKEIGAREHIPAAEVARETILAAMGPHAANAIAAE